MMHSKKHILFYSILIIFLMGIQEAFFNYLRILGAKPNLTLVAVCIIAVRMTKGEAMFFGFATGLYVDIVYSRYVGLYALLYMLICILLSIVSREDFKKTIWWPAAIGAPSFLLFAVVESFVVRLIAMYSVNSPQLYENYGVHFVTRLLPETLYDVIALVVLLIPIRWVLGKIRVRDEQMNY